MLIWLFGKVRPRQPRPSLRDRWDAARPRSEPTYDAYPDRVKPAPRPPRKTWLERLEERLAGQKPTYDAYPDDRDHEEPAP